MWVDWFDGEGIMLFRTYVLRLLDRTINLVPAGQVLRTGEQDTAVFQSPTGGGRPHLPSHVTLAAALLALPLLFGLANEAASASPVASFESTSSGAGESSGISNVRVNFSPPPVKDLTLSYNVRGRANRNEDFTVPDSVLVEANATHVNIPVTIISDYEFETLQTVTLVLMDTDDYDLGRAPWHTLFIEDDEADLVTRIREYLRGDGSSLSDDDKTRWKRVLKELGPEKVDLVDLNPMQYEEANSSSGQDTGSTLWRDVLDTLMGRSGG